MSTETRFAGVKFESEHIARWAVAINASKLFGGAWEYQPETIATPRGPCRPTFRVWWSREDYSWVDVKPVGHITTPDEHETFLAIADQCMGGLYLVTGLNAGHTMYLHRREPSSVDEPFLDPEEIAVAQFAQFQGWGRP